MSSATPDAQLAARRDRAFGAGAPLFYKHPLHIVRGEGVYLFDADGRRYVDMYNNVPCVGHANPARGRGDGAPAGHAQRPQPLPARRHRRLRRAPGGAARAGRSRASSSAAAAPRPTRWRCAWRASPPARRGIVCTNATYHGNSEAVGKLTRIGSGRNARRRRPRHSRSRRSSARSLPGASEAELCEAYLDRLREAIRSLEDDGAGFAGADRLLDLRQRGPARRARRLHAARRGDGARGRRPGDRRRGPGRLLPHRPLVGLRSHRLHARHRRDRQADGQRPAAGRHRGEPRAGRGLPRRDALLQHLRLEPAAGGGRHGGARRHRARRPARATSPRSAPR